MSNHPYESRLPRHFWRTGVRNSTSENLDFDVRNSCFINKETKIISFGTCFAQYISSYLKSHDYNYLDYEPAPPGLSINRVKDFGYGLYSARYGNIYTVSQFYQLVLELSGLFVADSSDIWKKNHRYFDSFRPTVEPNGFLSEIDVISQRSHHLTNVKNLISDCDIIILTLGMTECWKDSVRNVIYPHAPGLYCGTYDSSRYSLDNPSLESLQVMFSHTIELLLGLRSNRIFSLILSLSPVPLTATATEDHVLIANTLAKSKLRVLCDWVTSKFGFATYFPSYELVLNPSCMPNSFNSNLRTVAPSTVEVVMNHFSNVFLNSHPPSETTPTPDELVCEDATLEFFASKPL